MVIVDGHAHFHQGTPLERIMDHAHDNFVRASNEIAHGAVITPVIMVADTADNRYFSSLCHQVIEDPSAINQNLQTWRLEPTRELQSVLARRTDTDDVMVLIGGQQVVSTEKLEALIFGLPHEVLRGSLSELLETAAIRHALIIVPWGFGKWTGRRGRVVEEAIQEASYPLFFIGDNGGRTSFGGSPKLFRLAREKKFRILPGSDPLPLPNEHRRIGTYGFYTQRPYALDNPFRSLIKILETRETGALQFYGKLLPIRKFINNQIRLRLS
jgi:hypothetical protein